MKQLRMGARWVLLAMVILSGFLSTAGATFAQGSVTSFVSPMTGIPINTTGPWTIDTTSLVSQDGIESVTVFGEFEFMQVWFLPGNVPLVEARDVVLDSYAQTFGSFVEIDRGAYGNVSYSLDITTSEGIEFGVFSLFLGQRSSGYVEYYVYFGSLSLFAQGFASAQQNVRVNNAPVFDGVDGVGLQNLLLQNAGVTGATSGTTTTQAPPPPQPTQPTNQGQVPPQPTEPATTGTSTTPEGEAYLASIEAELAYLESTMGRFLNAYMSRETNDAWVQEMNVIAQEWADYPQRASAIVAPAGYETIDAQYRSLVTSVEDLAAGWNEVVTAAQAGDTTATSKLAMLSLDVANLQTQIDSIRAEMTGQATTGTTAQPTAETTTPTQPTPDTTTPTQPTGDTGTTTTTSPEGQAYLAALDAEMTYLQELATSFLSNFSMQNEAQAQELVRIGNEWSAYPQRAAGIVAPPGFETIDAQYRAIVNSVSNLGVLWQGVITSVQNNDGTFGSKMIDLTLEVTIVDAEVSSLKTTIAEQSAGTTAQPTQDTTTTTTTTTEPTQAPVDTGQTGTTGTTGMSPEQTAYLDSIRAETARLQTSIDDFSAKFASLADGTSPNTEQTAQEIAAIIDMWLNMPQTANQFVAPAGLEDVDAAYKQLANDFSSAASTFNTAIQQQGASDPAAQTTLQSFLGQLETLYASIGSLNTLIDQKAQSTQTTTSQQTTPPQPTQAPVDTGTTGTTGSPEGEAYLAALTTEIGNLRASFASFDEGIQLVGAGDQASVDQGNALINEAINYWANYEADAAAIIAPAGYESIDAQYRQMASEVPLLTQYFVSFLEEQDQAARDQALANYRATLESVHAQLDSLEAAIGSAPTGTTGTTTTPTETTTTSTTGQTETQTPTEPAGGQTDVTETGNRGQLPDPTGNQGNTGTTGSTTNDGDPEDLGFVEEGEYVSPQFDVEVTWDDRFVFDAEYLEETIGSDEENGSDFITLVWTGGEGDITVSIAEGEDFDPEGMLAFWESEDYLGNFEAGAEVLLSDASGDRAGVLILVGDEEEGVALYREAFCIDRQCSQVAFIMVIAPIDDAADIIADAEAVEIDGEEATGVFSTRQISRALP